ncbi:amidase [Mycobacterium sp. 050134]|uniref:amidase n=1 Tax=Mycobacterium sp. 050134 TaxID=3096111 RepID=UPI002EDA947D
MSSTSIRTSVSASLAQIRESDEHIQAFEEVFADDARARAELLDETASGAGDEPLRGMTVGVKDIFVLSGRAPGNGNRAVFDMLPRDAPEDDAALIRLLRDAGAVITGMTRSTELCWYEPTLTRNPHDLNCTPGGSSSGSAAAVAANMVSAAIGSQTNGSIVRPASYCGLFAYKAGYDRVDVTGMTRISDSFDHTGFFARDAMSLIKLAEVAGHFRVAGDISGSTLGVVDMRDLVGVDDDVLEAFKTYVRQLREAGHSVETVRIPELLASKTFDAYYGVLAPEIYQLHRRLLAPHLVDKLGPETVEILQRGRDTTATQQREAEKAVAEFRARVDSLFDRVDALILPAATSSAPKTLTNTGSPALSTLSSMAGVPIGVVPTGLGRSGLPVGMQIWSRLGADETALALLAALPSEYVPPHPLA